MQVFDLMRADEIAFEPKKDLLIASYFGESHLKKHKKERMIYPCSNWMRELPRLLISYREVESNNKLTLKDLVHPKNFDKVSFAAER